MTEKELIRGCIKEDKSCQKALFLQYASKMLTVCRRYARHQAEAEDMLQDSFIKIFANLNQFNFQGSFEGWIRRMSVNYCLDFLRKKDPIKFTDGITDQIEELEDIEDSELENVLNADISKNDWQNILFQLPEHFRIVFCLFFIENYSHKEIADTLNIALKTSRSRLHRAKLLLKEFIREYLALNQNGKK